MRAADFRSISRPYPDRDSHAIRHVTYNFPLPPSVKRQENNGQFATKRRRNKNNIMNSHRTNSTFGFFRPKIQQNKNQKSYFYATPKYDVI